MLQHNSLMLSGHPIPSYLYRIYIAVARLPRPIIPCVSLSSTPYLRRGLTLISTPPRHPATAAALNVLYSLLVSSTLLLVGLLCPALVA